MDRAISLVVPAVIGALFCYSRPAAAADVTIRPVALSGQPLPGVPGEVFGPFSKSQQMSLNNSGKLLFFGQNDQGVKGLWMGSAYPTQRLVYEDDPAPDTADGITLTNLRVLSPMSLNDSGQFVFSASLSGPGVTNNDSQGIWAGTPGNLHLVARTGSHPAALPSFTFRDLGGPSINNTGSVLFSHGSVGYIDSTTDRGIWLGQPGSPQPVGIQNQTAPGASPAKFIDFVSLVMNKTGHVAFQGICSMVDPQDRGVWMLSPSSSTPKLVARNQTIAPGTSAKFTDVNYPSVNASGQILFNGSLDNGTKGLWFGDPSSPRSIVKTGQRAPGTTKTFHDMWGGDLNDNGQIVFRATLDGNQSGLWAGQPNSLQLVVLESQQVPDAPTGVVFSDVASFLPIINNRGQIAVLVSITGPAIDKSLALVATDPAGNLHLIAAHDLVLDLGPDGLRTIDYVGYRYDFNDAGQIAFTATFTDGSSGVFMAYVPEPGALLSLLILPLLLRRRR